MKKIKKIMALALAVVMILAMGTVAFADEPANGTITITNASIGQKYSAYRVFDATYNTTTNTTSYTTNAAIKALIGAADPFVVASTADSAGRYAVQLKNGATIAQIQTWIETNLTSFVKVKNEESITSGNTLTWSGLPYGYYYVTSSLGSVVTIDTNTPNVSIHDKNKTVPDTPNKTDDEETAQIGDDVYFTVTFGATNYYKATDGDTAGTQITEYYVTDTPDGYDIDVTTLNVTVDGTDITDKITDEEVDSTGVLSFTIPWADASNNSIYASPATVVITYTGKVNADADDGQADNTVSITNNADITPKTDTENSKNYKITLNKVDENNVALSGAEFELYRLNTNGDAMDLVDNGNGTYRVATENDTTTTTKIVAGTATINGLDGNDKYYLKEIKAPDGYNMLTTPIEVEFKTTTVNGNQEEVISYADQTKNVENKKGTELPSTGGIGTTIFYIIGAVLVIGAGVLLVTRRRMRAE